MLLARVAGWDVPALYPVQGVVRDLETGRPVRRTNEAGETVFMNDEERQAELAKARAAADATCKA